MRTPIDLVLILGGCLVIISLGLLGYLLLPKRSRTSKPVLRAAVRLSELEANSDFSNPSYENTLSDEEDYDFLADKDGLPIKLDLARAYLEMGNYAEIEGTLQSVLEMGTPEQQEQAQLLLEQAKLAQSD